MIFDVYVNIDIYFFMFLSLFKRKFELSKVVLKLNESLLLKYFYLKCLKIKLIIFKVFKCCLCWVFWMGGNIVNVNFFVFWFKFYKEVIF